MVSRGNFSGHQGYLWENGEVQGKVEENKVAYINLVECVDEEEKWTLEEAYNTTKTEAKLAVTTAKMTTFECLYIELGEKVGDKKLYRLAKVSEKCSRHGSSEEHQLIGIKGVGGRYLY